MRDKDKVARGLIKRFKNIDRSRWCKHLNDVSSEECRRYSAGMGVLLCNHINNQPKCKDFESEYPKK